MSRVYLPSDDPENWRSVLADPDKHWRQGYSARALAYCWHEAVTWPPEIAELWQTASPPQLRTPELLLKLVEHQTTLPGKGYSSQNDLFVLARAGDGNLVSVTIEGKVNESFGESLKDWKANGKGFTANKRTRFESLCQALGLTEIADTIHYQLLHRAASAIFEAKRFNARYAVLIVHSFSPQRAHWEAFTHFVGLYGHVPQPDNLLELVQVDTLRLFAGWATGNLAYLEA